MDVFQLDNTWLVKAKLGDSFIYSSNKSSLLLFFQHLYCVRNVVPVPPSLPSYFFFFFLAILGVLFLVLLSVTYSVLCSPFCRLPRPLSNFITIFLPLHLSFRVATFLSFVSVLSSLLSSISFLLCMKQKWKGISFILLFYFSNEKAHQWACPGCALFSTTEWNTLVKWESDRYRGSAQ